MFDGVHFTGTVNLGNIVTAVVALAGAITTMITIRNDNAKWARRQRQQIEQEGQQTRKCVHQIPGHPDSRPKTAKTRSTDSVNPPIE